MERSSGDPGPSTVRMSRLPNTPRVSQVDSDDLDESLVGMLGERVQKSLGNFQRLDNLDLNPEVSLLLKLVIFRLGIYDPLTRSSPGAKLQNLRLASTNLNSRHPSRQTLLLYLLLHPPIFPSYVLTRLRQHALSQQWPDLPPRDWRKRAWKVILWLENASRLWELAGWGMFLFDPRYPSLLMRILKLRLVPSSSHLTRLVSYEFMNRQLVWSAFTEFMMFAVPRMPSPPTALSPSHLLPPLKSLFTRMKPIDYNSIPLLPSRSSTTTEKASRAAHSGIYAKLPVASCPICHMRTSSAPVPISDSSSGANLSLPPVHAPGEEDEDTQDEERIFVPAQTDCWGECRWCYYCIAGELAKYRDKEAARTELGKAGGKGKAPVEKEEERTWECLRCGGGATKAWRVGADPFSSEHGEQAAAIEGGEDLVTEAKPDAEAETS